MACLPGAIDPKAKRLQRGTAAFCFGTAVVPLEISSRRLGKGRSPRGWHGERGDELREGTQIPSRREAGSDGSPFLSLIAMELPAAAMLGARHIDYPPSGRSYLSTSYLYFIYISFSDPALLCTETLFCQ